MEVKVSYAPFRFSYENGTFTVENRFDFTNFSECKFKYEIICDDETVFKGEKKINVAPHKKGSFDVNVKLPESCKLGCFANLELIKDGESLGVLQQEIDVKKETLSFSNAPAVMSEDEHYITAQGESFKYVFDKSKANLCSMVIDGKEKLASPVRFCTIRPCTDNDVSLKGQWLRSGGWLSENLDKSYCHVYGLCLEKNKITFNASLAGVARTPYFRYTMSFEIFRDGTITVELNGKVKENCVWLPRLGLEFELCQKDADFEYFGKGPMENYQDISHHAPVGRYKSRAKKEYVPYVFPQEHGNHEKTSELIVSGIKFRAQNPFNFSVLAYPPEEILKAKHTNEVTFGKTTFVHIDYKMSGIGTGSCGPRVFEKYRLEEKDINFKFVISPK